MTTPAQRNANAAAQVEARKYGDNEYYGPHEPAKPVKSEAVILWERLTDNLGNKATSAQQLIAWQNDLNALYSLAQQAQAVNDRRRRIHAGLVQALGDIDGMDRDIAARVVDAIAAGEVDNVRIEG